MTLINRLSKEIYILIAVFAVFIIATSYTLYAYPKGPTPKNFKITIEKNNSEIILNCSEGCGWLNLSYTNYQKFQGINENGMTELLDDHTCDKQELADFLIAIYHTSKGVKLKGIKGTEWSELDIELDKGTLRTIDHLGIK